RLRHLGAVQLPDHTLSALVQPQQLAVPGAGVVTDPLQCPVEPHLAFRADDLSDLAVAHLPDLDVVLVVDPDDVTGGVALTDSVETADPGDMPFGADLPDRGGGRHIGPI